MKRLLILLVLFCFTVFQGCEKENINAFEVNYQTYMQSISSVMFKIVNTDDFVDILDDFYDEIYSEILTKSKFDEIVREKFGITEEEIYIITEFQNSDEFSDIISKGNFKEKIVRDYKDLVLNNEIAKPIVSVNQILNLNRDEPTCDLDDVIFVVVSAAGTTIACGACVSGVLMSCVGCGGGIWGLWRTAPKIIKDCADSAPGIY